ncbi:LLM class flavin-dependent oxidoreductase, partial [Alcaligenes pakistanensis]
HCTMVGTPESIADQIEQWWRNEGADGFNLMPPSLPNGIRDFVEQVIPVLQKRGLFRHDYEHTTLRGH